MPYEDFKIHRAWHDVIIYDEGEGRRLELSCPSMEEPAGVTVPDRELWLDQTPAWAHERRSIIIDRLRSAKCIVYERGKDITRALSPDKTFFLETGREYDERSGPWEFLRIVAVPENRIVLSLAYGLATSPQFPNPGVIVLPISPAGVRCDVYVDVAANTFTIDPAEQPQPLDQLGVRLNALYAMNRRPVPPVRQSLRAVIGNVTLSLVGLMFVAGGIWITFAGKTAKDRWIGASCVFFFGLCSAVSLRELFQSRTSRHLPDDQ